MIGANKPSGVSVPWIVVLVICNNWNERLLNLNLNIFNICKTGLHMILSRTPWRFQFISISKANEVFVAWSCNFWHRPLARYANVRVAHAPVMPGTFSPPTRASDPDMHHGTCVTQVPWCMPGSLTSGFLWSRWRGKRSRHSRRMRNPQSYVSGKRPMRK